MGEPGIDPVKRFTRWVKIWQEDSLLQKVIRNTGYLFSSSTISMGLSSLQGFLAAYLLGPEGYGILGMVVMFATSINRLLSFRMNEMVIKFAGQYLANKENQQAAAVVKLAALVEAGTSIIAYGLLVLLAPLAAQYIIKDPLTSSWVIVYGLIILVNLLTETSTAVLHIGGHFRSQAVLNLSQSVTTTTLVVIAFFLSGDVLSVLLAYLVGKVVFGLGTVGVALYWMKPTIGAGWWRVPLKTVENWRQMIRFAISTNISGTVNMVIRDSEVLWVGFFLSPLEAGYYKFGLAVMNVILMPITPFISTTYPEINKAIARKGWAYLRSLIGRTTQIALVWTVLCGLGMALVGPLFLGWFKQGAYLPSYAVILILLVGFGIANIFFWSRTLLLAFGMPDYPLKVTLVVGALKTALMFVVVRPFGYLAQAALLSGYFVFSVGLTVGRGWRELRRAEQEDLPVDSGRPV